MGKRLTALLLLFFIVMGIMSGIIYAHEDNYYKDGQDIKANDELKINISAEGEKGKNDYYIGKVKILVDILCKDDIKVKNKRYIVKNGSSIASKEFDGESFEIDSNGKNINIYVIVEDESGGVYISPTLSVNIHIAQPILSINRSDYDIVHIQVIESYNDKNLSIDNLKEYLKIDIKGKDFNKNEIGCEEPHIEWNEEKNNIYSVTIKLYTDACYDINVQYDNKKMRLYMKA